jgi:GTP-binding protein EngB required for normal cell division
MKIYRTINKKDKVNKEQWQKEVKEIDVMIEKIKSNN